MTQPFYEDENFVVSVFTSSSLLVKVKTMNTLAKLGGKQLKLISNTIRLPFVNRVGREMKLFVYYDRSIYMLTDLGYFYDFDFRFVDLRSNRIIRLESRAKGYLAETMINVLEDGTHSCKELELALQVA